MIELLSGFPDNKMWLALLTLAFFGGLRGAEYLGADQSSAPKVNQLQFGPDPVRVMHYKVNRSKTTINGYIILLGCSRTKVCPLCCMVEYLSSRNKVKPYQVHDYLFVYTNGARVSKEHVNALLKGFNG